MALWWLSLPWLAVTSRLGAWAHAAWTHAVSAAALGLVDLAWQATTQQRPLLAAIGVWALWLVAAATAVVVLLHLRQVASSEERGPVRLRPAVVTALAVCGVGAAATSLAVQQPSSPTSVEASSSSPVSPAAPTDGSTPGASPTVPTTPAPAATTSAPRETQAAARSAQRTATTTARPTSSSTTTTRSPSPSTTTSSTATSSTTVTPPIEIKIWPTNNPHTTPPGHR
jgi:hypothetical protein